MVEVRRGVGLKETIPVKVLGTRKLPERSVPMAKGTHLEATRLASPPELPPEDL